MNGTRGSAMIVVAAVLMFHARTLHGQTLTSTSGASLAIAAPSESEYDAGASLGSGNYTISTTCTGTGSADCRLFFQYGTNSQGQQVDMQYAVVALSSNDCRGAVASPTTWIAVQSTLVVLSTNKNQSCVATFQFRVSPLTWSQYPFPGPGSGTYRQRINFVFTRP